MQPNRLNNLIYFSSARDALIESSARLYHCARCRRQVIVCRHCDRGQMYCASHCAQIRRRESLRAAAKRYRQTHQGKLKSALRQQRYRQLKRQQQKVTHHRSSLSPPRDLLTPIVKKTRRRIVVAKNQQISCHFCGHSGWIFLRLGFLRRLSQVSASTPPQGPPGCG